MCAIFPGLLAGVYAFSKRKDVLSREEKAAVVKEVRAEASRELEDKIAEVTEQAARERKQAIESAMRTAKPTEPGKEDPHGSSS